MVGSSWTFIQKGLDDFRDGVPPDTAPDKMVLKVSNILVQYSVFYHMPPAT
jgi:hypothetical protein